MNPGSYIGFYDPKLRGADKHTTFEIGNDARALERMKAKKKFVTGRGSLRRRRMG